MKFPLNRVKSVHYYKKGIISHTKIEIKKFNFNFLINWEDEKNNK